MKKYIPRISENDIIQGLMAFPVVGLLGPRQCGKSTLARKLLKSRTDVLFLDMERQADMRRVADPDFLFQTQQEKLICIDEVQRVPELFPAIRVAVDNDDRPGKFLLLGSASQELIRNSSETLAGRIHYQQLTPFLMTEIQDTQHKEPLLTLLARGGYPRSLLAPSEEISVQWRDDFIQTFLERDIPQFGFSIPARQIHRLWTMLAHYHGSVCNYAKIGQSLSVSRTTVGKYIDILSQTFMVRVLQPMHFNTKKRLIKSPKIYIRDTGLLHSLLEIADFDALLGHPVYGASWEGMCIENICAALPQWRPSYYRTSNGAEIDLIMERGEQRLAFECKASSAPEVTKGFKNTIAHLQPQKTWIVAQVKESYPYKDATVISLPALLKQLIEYK